MAVAEIFRFPLERDNRMWPIWPRG